MSCSNACSTFHGHMLNCTVWCGVFYFMERRKLHEMFCLHIQVEGSLGLSSAAQLGGRSANHPMLLMRVVCSTSIAALTLLRQLSIPASHLVSLLLYDVDSSGRVLERSLEHRIRLRLGIVLFTMRSMADSKASRYGGRTLAQGNYGL